MIFQQPSELPQPTPSPPEQQFGAYSLEYFIKENGLYLLAVLLMLTIVIGYSIYLRRKKREKEKA